MPVVLYLVTQTDWQGPLDTAVLPQVWSGLPVCPDGALSGPALVQPRWHACVM